MEESSLQDFELIYFSGNRDSLKVRKTIFQEIVRYLTYYAEKYSLSDLVLVPIVEYFI